MLNKLWNRLFSKTDKASEGVFIIAQLNDKIMPIDRGEVYEDPLDELLKLKGYGEISGGGTLLELNNEVSYCDVEINLNVEPSPEIIHEIVTKLELLGAPKGSKLIIESTGQTIPFGKLEGLAIYLDGINLSDEVYANLDLEAIDTKLKELTSNKSEVVRYWQGNTETALYFYNASFSQMKEAIAEFVDTDPECENARIVQIA
ncbi:hypothetical protein [Mucilaginibacter auburnensis]|uniref:Uncharacterized protein n=1 Tax=Mucilaginibacter auburnensis TaxID=1457233 RepID=A0A2H9VMC7_9SPHI|nr:hypothetical protein [Mucilaginibacter auburnensis]PJJ79489.1 hypothetical protein CLV57_2623 [Mucilaginibacter auburnensis]